MFPKINRLDKAGFSLLKKQGRRINGKLISVIYSPSEGNLPSKAAIIVSKKVSLKSVVRNEIKRKIRLEVKKYLTNNNLGQKLLFIARKEILLKNQYEVGQEVYSILKKINFI